MFWDLGISLMCFKCLENNSLVDCLEDSIRILDRFPGTFFFFKASGWILGGSIGDWGVDDFEEMGRLLKLHFVAALLMAS